MASVPSWGSAVSLGRSDLKPAGNLNEGSTVFKMPSSTFFSPHIIHMTQNRHNLWQGHGDTCSR